MGGSDAARKVWPACKVVGSACDDGGFEGDVWLAGGRVMLVSATKGSLVMIKALTVIDCEWHT